MLRDQRIAMRPDRRTDRRLVVDLMVNKIVGDEVYLCRGVNLSRWGILLYKVFEPNLEFTDVTLEFQLPGDRHVIRASGITLAEHSWARAHGVRFTRISDDDAMRIEAFLTGQRAALAASSH